MAKALDTSTHASRDTLYREAVDCDKAIFAEQRSNLLLIAGEHYSRRGSNLLRRIRDTQDLSDEQKLRLTKNHIQKIVKNYCNTIISSSPGVGFMPKNESEPQDQKAADLHHSVWRDAVEKYNMPEKVDDWCDDFVGIGEVATKIFWDAGAGKIKGYELQMDPEGQPISDEMGQAQYDKTKPIFAGAFVFEQVYGFNLRRAPEAKTMESSPYLIIDKMVGVDDLMRRYPDKKSLISPSADQTFIVFDSAKGGYRKTDKEVLVREWYFRPSADFPNGQYFFDTKDGELDKGDLPGGVFPIVFEAFDKLQTTPRGVSPVKIMRPYQAEINRAGSKIAEHQITLGDDKMAIQDGTKLSAGTALPGIRAINYSGIEPKIIPGRDGSQYLDYMQAQITELYQVMNMDDGAYDKDGQVDPFMMLFRASRQKTKFQRYIRRFERFLVNVVKVYLQLAKIHLPEDALIYAVGTNEQINLAEFKNANDICYEIKVEAQSEDFEGKLGKQMALNHVLQYVGPQMKPDDIGKVLKAMPYANLDSSFDDLTIDYDSALNDVLALERGELPPVHQYDNHVYMMKRLSSRMRQASFKYLDQEIQANFENKMNVHKAYEAQNQIRIQRASQGYIPTDGYLVACDFYVKDPSDKNGVKTRRARVPYSALQWLVEHLEAQGQGLETLEDMNQGVAAGVADQMSSGPQQGSSPDGMGGPAPAAPDMGQGVEHDVPKHPNLYGGL